MSGLTTVAGLGDLISTLRLINSSLESIKKEIVAIRTAVEKIEQKTP